jgi:hypothetical protein
VRIICFARATRSARVEWHHHCTYIGLPCSKLGLIVRSWWSMELGFQWRGSVRAKLLLCVKFLYACNKLHCGTGKWRHLPNYNDSCDWSSHLWLRAGNPHPSSLMYLMILACGLRGPKTWCCSLVMVCRFRRPRVEWCMKCVISRYLIREAVTKYDGDVITANRTFP